MLYVKNQMSLLVSNKMISALKTKQFLTNYKIYKIKTPLYDLRVIYAMICETAKHI